MRASRVPFGGVSGSMMLPFKLIMHVATIATFMFLSHVSFSLLNTGVDDNNAAMAILGVLLQVALILAGVLYHPKARNLILGD